MTLVAEKQMEHIGQTHGMKDHDHDLVHELNDRLDAIWRYDQYIANADGKPQLQDFWRKQKKADQKCVDQLRQLIAEEVKAECF